MSNAKKMLPTGAIKISKGPGLGLFMSSLNNYGDNGTKIYLTLQIVEEKRTVGYSFAAYVKIAGRTVNPHTKVDLPGEKWYKGNLTISLDGGRHENRGFVFEFKSRTGTLAKRGILFQLSEANESAVSQDPNQLEFDFEPFI